MRSRQAWLFALSIVLPACSNQKLMPPATAASLALTVSAESIVADGKGTATISFAAAQGTVTVTTTRGSFVESGAPTAVVSDGSGRVTLIGCDARASLACAGRASVTAVDASGASGQVLVVLTMPSCPAGAVEICDDGIDNNCNGLIDCADPACGQKACKLPNGLGGLCPAGGGACACPNTPEVCGDGIDNDCNGLTDCADPACQPHGNALGGVCDARGHTCAPPQLAGGTSLCNVCSGNGGTPEAHETSCGDNHDNDCDGLIDCQDPDCANVACAANNKVCSPTTLQCSCASTVEDCNDHVDNNCDGLVDCADPQCASTSAACGPSGLTCGGGGAAATSCSCSGNGGAPQATESSCADGRDNDCNGLVDCADAACRPTGTNTFGLVCGAHGLRCDATGGCACPGGQVHETSCGDGLDNDCDGLIDCADPDCNGIVCSAVGGKVCSTGACSCPYGNSPETTCNDGIDNDCNGVADCNDAACAGKQCGPSGTQLCYGSAPNTICKDTTSQYALTLTAARGAIPADGMASVVVTANLKKDTTGNGTFAVQSNQAISFVSSDANAPVSPTALATDFNGNAVTTLKSDPAGGTVRVTASYTIPNSTTVITATATVAMPVLGSITLVNQQYSLMGARYSGYQETNFLTFQLLDSTSAPYPAGLAVNFTHGSLGGSYLGNSATPCPSGPSNCTAATGVTDGNGQVQVMLHSGSVANVVSVAAGASAGGVSAAGSASSIAVVGARASGAHISVDCTPKNIPALTNQDCANSQYFGQSITCTASLADRFNNVLGVGTLITFNSEAGAAGPPALTPNYDPTQAPTAQPGVGRASDFVAVGGYGLPVDVAALPATTPPSPKASAPAEFALTYVDGCGSRTHNPRDGLSTIIASAVGEEGFVDGSNGCPADGVYQGPAPGGCGGGRGENFIDSGEPFVDANDNGVRDANEAYVDANNNGAYDPPNGVWDATSVIWAQTRVVYTGAASVAQSNGQEQFSRFFATTLAAGQSPAATATVSFALTAGTSSAFGIYFVDGNFNAPAPASKYSAAPTAGNIGATLSQPPSAADRIGMGFSQQYCPSPNRSSFDRGSARAAVASVVAGSVTLTGMSGMTASDVGNYLTLSGAVNAGNNGIFQIVSVLSSSSVTVSNAQAVAGDLVDWVDSQSDMTGCSSSCQSSPCYLVPHIGSFLYGSIGTVTVSAAPMTELGESVQSTCTTAGSAVAIRMSGQTR